MSVTLERPPMPWGGITDPLAHNPDQYRYVVHAHVAGTILTALTMRMGDIERGVQTSEADAAMGNQAISLVKYPERLAERVSLSMSLIDQDHTGTAGHAGLIVEAPASNLIATSAHDIGTDNGSPKALRWRAARSSVVDGDTLLEMSEPTRYNEVLAWAQLGGNALKLAGFFYKTTADGTPFNRVLAFEARIRAGQLGLPAVAIESVNPFSEDKVITDAEKGLLAVQLQGRKYYLDTPKDLYRFRCMDERERPFFASPTDMSQAIAYAVEQGALSREQAKDIRQRYQAADAARRVPQVVFSEDGSFDSMTFHEGYGMAETRTRIDRQGMANTLNVTHDQEQLAAAFVGLDTALDSATAYHYPSPRQMRKIVRRACGALEPEQAQRVRNWYTANASAKQWSRRSVLSGLLAK